MSRERDNIQDNIQQRTPARLKLGTLSFMVSALNLFNISHRALVDHLHCPMKTVLQRKYYC